MGCPRDSCRSHRRRILPQGRCGHCPCLCGRTVRLLLDTQVALWWLVGAKRLSAAARRRMAASSCVVSAASVWDVAIKHRLGKLPVAPERFRDALVGAGAVVLPVSDEHAIASAAVVLPNDDPSTACWWPSRGTRASTSRRRTVIWSTRRPRTPDCPCSKSDIRRTVDIARGTAGVPDLRRWRDEARVSACASGWSEPKPADRQGVRVRLPCGRKAAYRDGGPSHARRPSPCESLATGTKPPSLLATGP